MLGSFARQEKVTIRRYLEFVANGIRQPSPWSMLKNQIYLGSDRFIDHVQANIPDRDIPEVPKIQKRSVPKKLYEYEAYASSRNEAIGLAYRNSGYTLVAIGKYYGLHYSTVSRIIHTVSGPLISAGTMTLY